MTRSSTPVALVRSTSPTGGRGIDEERSEPGRSAGTPPVSRSRAVQRRTAPQRTPGVRADGALLQRRPARSCTPVVRPRHESKIPIPLSRRRGCKALFISPSLVDRARPHAALHRCPWCSCPQTPPTVVPPPWNRPFKPHRGFRGPAFSRAVLGLLRRDLHLGHAADQRELMESTGTAEARVMTSRFVLRGGIRLRRHPRAQGQAGPSAADRPNSS
jgi:hypothetical protein